MKHIQAKLDENFYKEVRLLALENQLNLSEMIVNGLKMYVHLLKCNKETKIKIENEVKRVTTGSEETGKSA